LKLKA